MTCGRTCAKRSRERRLARERLGLRAERALDRAAWLMRENGVVLTSHGERRRVCSGAVLR
jgi:hypothetical protein